mmetsp:Transcript_77885/g.218273  ORF Transcript_77885/g.218273 Transcript_77885/m.218273 type:complete len:201 (+) Transcript_77885:255-857(+)
MVRPSHRRRESPSPPPGPSAARPATSPSAWRPTPARGSTPSMTRRPAHRRGTRSAASAGRRWRRRRPAPGPTPRRPRTASRGGPRPSTASRRGGRRSARRRRGSPRAPASCASAPAARRRSGLRRGASPMTPERSVRTRIPGLASTRSRSEWMVRPTPCRSGGARAARSPASRCQRRKAARSRNSATEAEAPGLVAPFVR